MFCLGFLLLRPIRFLAAFGLFLLFIKELLVGASSMGFVWLVIDFHPNLLVWEFSYIYCNM